MNIDQKLKQALAQERDEIDKLMLADEGLMARVFGVWQGKMRVWILFTYVFTIAATLLFIFCGYQAWISTDTHDRVFWGICFLASLLVQISLKMWLFMEMNRSSGLRELKRLEIEVARLKEAVTKTTINQGLSTN